LSSRRQGAREKGPGDLMKEEKKGRRPPETRDHLNLQNKKKREYPVPPAEKEKNRVRKKRTKKGRKGCNGLPD